MPRTIAGSRLFRGAEPATADAGAEKVAASKQPRADVSRATVRMGPHLWTGGSPELRVDLDSERVLAGRCYRMQSVAAATLSAHVGEIRRRLETNSFLQNLVLS